MTRRVVIRTTTTCTKALSGQLTNESWLTKTCKKLGVTAELFLLAILFNPQPTARNLDKPPAILRLGSKRRSKPCSNPRLKRCKRTPSIEHQTVDPRGLIPLPRRWLRVKRKYNDQVGFALLR
jgi:hypothetical protein